MDAFDVMTTSVVTVSPEASMREIAQLLLQHGISAVPVVDGKRAVIGMVSEGDLLRFNAEDRDARRDWWLAILAQGETLSPEFLSTLRTPKRTAREIMSAPVVTISEHTDLKEIGKLLATHRIKRVPVLRDGRIVGIVSRADLVRALAMLEPGSGAPRPEGIFALGTHFAKNKAHAEGNREKQHGPAPVKEKAFSAADFRSLVEAAESKKTAEQEAQRKAAEGKREHQIQEAIDHHVTDEHWLALHA
jgi:CBS domain-containing protein